MDAFALFSSLYLLVPLSLSLSLCSIASLTQSVFTGSTRDSLVGKQARREREWLGGREQVKEDFTEKSYAVS